MRRLTWLPVCAALAFALAGCWIFYPPYPKYITDLGDSADYPLSAAGFERRSIISDAPGKRDVSVYYRYCRAERDRFIDVGAVLRTTRIAGPDETVRSRFEMEKASLLEIDPDPDGLNEGTVTLSKNGRDYTALKVSLLGHGGEWCFWSTDREHFIHAFEPPVPRYVELIVWRHEDRILTLRGFAKPENQDIAPAKNLELLDAVNWTALPF